MTKTRKQRRIYSAAFSGIEISNRFDDLKDDETETERQASVEDNILLSVRDLFKKMVPNYENVRNVRIIKKQKAEKGGLMFEGVEAHKQVQILKDKSDDLNFSIVEVQIVNKTRNKKVQEM